jgi:hypothetical protein
MGKRMSRLRGCDMVNLKVEDVAPHGMIGPIAPASGGGKPDIPSGSN